MKAKKTTMRNSSTNGISANSCFAKCGDGNETKSIVFQIGHRKSWPLSGGLAPFAEYYNKTFKGQKDFMPR